MTRNRSNVDLKKILRTRGKEDEEHAPLFDQFFSLSFRKFADIGVNLLKNSKITPNQITIARAIIFLPLIFYFFSRGTYFNNILGILCCTINSAADHLDGNLARAKSLTSELGAWLDHNLDRIAVYSMLAGVILGSCKLTQNNIFLIAGIFVLFLHAMIVNISNDFDKMFGGGIFFDFRLKETVYSNKESTIFDKILVNMFIFNSFWSYLFFAIRYQVLIGAALNIMPYMIFYWLFTFAFRGVFLYSIYPCILTKKESWSIFINELKKRYKKRSEI